MNLVRTRVIAASAAIPVILVGAPAPAASPADEPAQLGSAPAGAMEPVAVQPGAVHPGAAQPGAVQPGAVQRDAAQRDPVRPGPALQTFSLAPTGGASPTERFLDGQGSARADAAGGALAVSQRATQPFSLLGATWTDPRARLTGTIEVRTRSVADGQWTGWTALESDGRSPAEPDSADGGGRGGTDPAWVGTSDGVQARVAAGGGTAPLPAGLRLDLINPDDAAEPELSRSARAGEEPDVAADGQPGTARVAIPARPAPKMITRSGWGANEAIVQNPPEFTTDVQVMFVHHSAGSNSYSCRDSARIVRSIAAYHVRSNGWNDIGYNFLVDKCGTLFEGRKGGVNRAVLGAHTMGFNAHSSAIAVLGDYRGQGVSATVRNVIAQVAAYKLGTYGNLPGGRTVLVSNGSDRYPQGTKVTLNRVSGHRDTGRTECPGDSLYHQLGTIRAVAGAGPANLAFSRMVGAASHGATYYTRGLISPLWDTSTPSAMLDRFDVYVDGTMVASARNLHRKTTLRLSAGRHTVSLRAFHLNGRTATITATVVADATAPRFASGPSVVLRTGSLSGSVPVRLGWAATDVGGLRSVALTRPSSANLGVSAHVWRGVARPGVANTWSLRATDRAGNVRDASVTRTPVVLSEATAARTGSWTTLRNTAYLSGTAMRSVTAQSSMSWRFTGRSAALGVSRTGASGRATIYVDGSRIGTLDLRSASTLHRQAIWAKNWGATGVHTVKVVVVAATGRPGVILDGLVVLR